MKKIFQVLMLVFFVLIALPFAGLVINSLAPNSAVANVALETFGWLYFHNAVAIPNAITISAGSGVPSYTLTSFSKAMWTPITCSDTDGCALYLSETGAKKGQMLVISNSGSNTITVEEASNVSHLSGTTVALGADDNISLLYDGTEWIEIGATNNH